MGLVMLTLLTLMIFEKLHALEGSSASDELVRELGLVVWLAVASILVIDLLVSVLCVVYRLLNQQWLLVVSQLVVDGAVKGTVVTYPNRT